MTRQEVQEILKSPFYGRTAKGLPILEWEHCAKKFYKIPNDLAMEHLMEISGKIRQKDDDPTILKCEIADEAYFFGIGLEECENLPLEQLRKLYNHGTWYVYTWSD